MAWTTPRTWVAGEAPTAATLNTHIRDNLDAIATWASYTPSWTASTTNPTLGNGTLTGRYINAGKTYVVEILLTFGSTTTVGSGVYQWTLPATPATGIRLGMGNAVLFDTSAAAVRPRHALWNTANLVLTDESGANVTNAVPWTWATGDTIGIHAVYRAA